MDMAYNMILSRPWIHEIDVVPSTLHQVIKFPSQWGALTEHGRIDVDSRPDSIQELEENENIKMTIEELEAIELFLQWPEKKVYIGANLSHRMKDQLIDATAGHELLSFLDAYSGYNQIKMDPLDEEKTSFITGRGTYCYKVMSFGLKNAGAMYQRLVAKMFQEHLGNTMEVYIDDMLVKSQQAGNHIQHLSDTFQILRKFNMKQNPEKCAFGVSLGKFLEFLVSNCGIEVNPAQFKAIEEIPDMLTSKKEDQFEWYKECQQALKNLKVYLLNPLLLTKPKDGEKLLIHLAVSEVAVSAVLVREDQGEGLGIVLVPPTDEIIRQAIKCHPITNNEAEYEAVIEGLVLAQELGIEQVVIKRDSQLIPRENNVEADALANLASAAEMTNDENASSWQIKRITSTPYHPVGNRQVESTNKVIIKNLKKRLEESKGNWPEVLPGVLWAYRTIAKTSTRETPFSLVYGAEALILVEIGEPSTRYTQAIEESNEEEMRINLDLIEERREATLIRMAVQKQVMERYYNRKVRLRYFKIGDFVLKKVFQSTRAANAGKLSPTWEGPYKIHGIAGKGAYELEMMDGKILPSHWNVVHLKRYYF
ncbi:uncharacterized protein [Nicotiana sylvestris]|uniref:uncharacterized protein n=1 Tax=Nicotiana sylvestris TaxID=4096 RepID=UPI00388C76E4